MCSILAASTKQISFTFLVYLHECQKKSIVMKYNYKYCEAQEKGREKGRPRKVTQ